jgi:hypothetical protein
VKFVLLVEGQTEKYVAEFLERWLNARLETRVGFKTVPFEGRPQYVKDVRQKTEKHLNDPQVGNDYIAAIGLLDLYGADFYPAGAETVEERYQAGKEFIEKAVGNSRFHQFFAVHEIEAWLISDPGRFRTEVRSEVAKMSKSPEGVDDNRPPSKRLDELYRTKLKDSYKKVINARNEFPKLDPE